MAFPDGIADFRSDTVTRPTPTMRRAMADAEVGDDVYREDPTVTALQETAAGAVGMEAALFTPSGTMANQIAIHLHTRPGDGVVCVPTAHVRKYELGAAGALSGVTFLVVDSDDATMTADALDAALDPNGPYYDIRPGLLTWENTHNASGGTILPAEVMAKGSAFASEHEIPVHLDGARIWNASVAAATPVTEWSNHATSMMFCFSKGLGAPIGSMLCGPAAFIEEARRVRKRLGGGMRQVGVLAAAASAAFGDRDRLTEDHDLARRLGEGIASRYPDAVDLGTVQTNMVRVGGDGLPHGAPAFHADLDAAGVKVGFAARDALRFVTHRDVDGNDVDRVLAVLDSA
ncbi:MAG: low specificity L-threonine aldolase [Acidimicrobiia bacterium]|nr:low specificity L-threonine aldolase [Acidimicrobiia bacterium]